MTDGPAGRRGGSFVERVWYGRDRVASLLRTTLLPLERVFGGIIGARDILYDAGWLSTHATALPAISIGNLSVGGTGKTPIAAWIAHGLAARGAKPAVVLRGYGDDEPLVHRALNPRQSRYSSVPIGSQRWRRRRAARREHRRA